MNEAKARRCDVSDLGERLHEAGIKFDGHVTNGSLSEQMKVVEAEVQERERRARLDELRSIKRDLYRFRNDELSPFDKRLAALEREATPVTVELKSATFTEVAEHFQKVTRPVEWPEDDDPEPDEATPCGKEGK